MAGGRGGVRGIREPVTGPAACGARQMRWRALAVVRVCPVLDLIPLTTFKSGIQAAFLPRALVFLSGRLTLR